MREHETDPRAILREWRLLTAKVGRRVLVLLAVVRDPGRVREQMVQRHIRAQLRGTTLR